MATDIYCDFDGAITKIDTFDYLLTKLAEPTWETIESCWEAGEIGARECMLSQTKLIKGGWAAVTEILDTVEIDPTFPQFVRWCKTTGRNLYVVSDGLDRVIEYILAKEQLTVGGIWANRLIEASSGQFFLDAPYAASDCPQGVCKCRILERSSPKVMKVVIGDGRSDFCWAGEADLLFAKSKLLQHCIENKIAHVPFENFASISAVIEERDRTPILACSMKI
jgi:2,3-diketo-5-methylthio-1-phosphopentane phosphatase